MTAAHKPTNFPNEAGRPQIKWTKALRPLTKDGNDIHTDMQNYQQITYAFRMHMQTKRVEVHY